MKKKIPVIAKELKDFPHVPVSALQPLQGNLKDLSEREGNKLKKSLLTYGVIVPFCVWEETGKLLDGHQRQRVFTKEEWLIDVPVLYISAANEQEAKQRLLVISSQYGRITQEGFDEFTYDLSDDWIQESVHFDALPFVFSDFQPTDPANDPYAEWEGMPDYDQETNTGAALSIKVHFKTEEDVKIFSGIIDQAVTMKTTWLWFPKREKSDITGYKAIVNE